MYLTTEHRNCVKQKLTELQGEMHSSAIIWRLQYPLTGTEQIDKRSVRYRQLEHFKPTRLSRHLRTHGMRTLLSPPDLSSP